MTPGQDAECLPECEDGYTFDDVSKSCSALPSCTLGDPGFVDCGANRECAVMDTVQCGECLAGYIDDGNGTCIPFDCAYQDCENTEGRNCAETILGPQCTSCLDGWILHAESDTCIDVVTCEELSCALNEICIEAETDGTDARCVVPDPCEPAQVATSTGACVECAHCYDEAGDPYPGVSGVANGGYAYGSICVCELQDGWFQSADDGAVKKCDADSDGWVSQDIAPVLRLAGGANPMAENHACQIRTADRFVLFSDDYHSDYAVRETRTVFIDEILVAHGIPRTVVKTGSDGRAYVELIEPEITDDPLKMELRYQETDPSKALKPYGATSLSPIVPPSGSNSFGLVPGQFGAKEVNPLTKACNDDQDDLNFDSVADVRQSHENLPNPLADNVAPYAPVFYRMAFFLELARSYHRDRTAECGGSLPCHGEILIQEKIRSLDGADITGNGFELVGDATGLTTWQTCARGRDPDYPGPGTLTFAQNSDFYRWHEECLDDSGGCQIDSGGYAHVPYDGRPVNLSGANLGVVADRMADGSPRWPGMNHASQFKCVSFSNNLPFTDTLRQVPEIGGLGHSYTLNDCRLNARTSQAPPWVGNAINPWDPVFHCGAVTDEATYQAQAGQNYFIALGYEDYAYPENYSGGCLDQGADWEFKCLVGAESADPSTYGDLFCSCGDTRAGVQCEFGCPNDILHSSRIGVNAQLQGFWMCAMPTQVDKSLLDDPVEGYQLYGGIGVAKDPPGGVCENAGNCGTGYQLNSVAAP
jgi:hypothetical protein